MEQKRRNRAVIIGAVVLAVLAAVFAAVYFIAMEPPAAGEKDITVKIIHSDKTEKTVEISTDAQYLRRALEEKNLIQGTESPAGLYITVVDGETADWEKYQQYWALSQNGEYLMTGVDTTPIKDGDQFELTFTEGS